MGFQFAGKALHTAVWVAAVSLFMELLGFSTQKWITAGSLGTVLLTLAGREIFTNFLSSLMIHATRPFVLNQWIQTKIQGYEVSGTVENVGWWAPTIIRGDDREAIHIPNQKFTVNVVRNLSQKTHWRIKTHFAISHLDVNKINNIVADMRKVLSKNPQVEQQKLHRRVFLENINPENQALMILVSCFVKTSHFEEYLCVKEAILLDLLRVISHHRARLATPIRTILKGRSADMENIPFSETIITEAGPVTSLPILLKEPSYKINGDDKTKTERQPTRTNEEQENKATTASTSGSKATTASTSGSKADKASTTLSGLEADPQVAETVPNTEADSKVTGITISKSTEGPGVGNTSSDSNSGPTVAATSSSSSDSKLDPEVTTALPDLKDEGLAHPHSVLKNSDKQLKKASSGDAQRSSKTDKASLSTTASVPSSSKSQLEGLDSMGLKSKDIPPHGAAMKKSTVSSDTDTDKPRSVPLQGIERSPSSSVTRSSLEDNIVLGVALEGSKRTLPIEEDVPSSTSAETKELAACGNGKGSSSAGMGKKDDDQRDQER